MDRLRFLKHRASGGACRGARVFSREMLARLRFVLAATILVSTGVTAVVACTAPAPKSQPLNARDDDKDTDPDVGNDKNPDTQLGESDELQADGTKPPGRVYAHTASLLFLYDPLAVNGAGKIDLVAAFDCLVNWNSAEGVVPDRVLDIAIDRTGNMFGTTDLGFIKISPVDATCSYIARPDGGVGKYPNSLAFMPIGTVDDTKEALVGYGFDANSNATEFLRIDTTTGAITKVGNLNPNGAGAAGQQTQYAASGDIIGLSRGGNRAFLTVKETVADGGTANTDGFDQLAEVNPKTGAYMSIVGSTKLKDLYGVGQWAGQAYGFSFTGDVVKVDLETGRAVRVAIDVGFPVKWTGAGVTTVAPTAP